MHLKIDGDYLYPEQVKLTTGAVHEVNEMFSLCLAPGDIHVMNRGYVDYKKFHDMEMAGSFFVTRMKVNCQHVENECHFTAATDAVRYDGLISLSSAKDKENYIGIIRKVSYHDD